MIKTVRHAPGFYGVRRQAKRDAALASKAGFDIRHKQTKAASGFACRRTRYSCDRHF